MTNIPTAPMPDEIWATNRHGLTGHFLASDTESQIESATKYIRADLHPRRAENQSVKPFCEEVRKTVEDALNFYAKGGADEGTEAQDALIAIGANDFLEAENQTGAALVLFDKYTVGSHHRMETKEQKEIYQFNLCMTGDEYRQFRSALTGGDNE